MVRYSLTSMQLAALEFAPEAEVPVAPMVLGVPLALKKATSPSDM